MLQVLAYDNCICGASTFKEVVASATTPGNSVQLVRVALDRNGAKSCRRRSRAWLYMKDLLKIIMRQQRESPEEQTWLMH